MLAGWMSPGVYGSSFTRPDSTSALMSRSERSTLATYRFRGECGGPLGVRPGHASSPSRRELGWLASATPSLGAQPRAGYLGSGDVTPTSPRQARLRPPRARDAGPLFGLARGPAPPPPCGTGAGPGARRPP